jgi:hypothetical protein
MTRAAFDAVFAGEGIEIVTCAVRTPRVNSITETWTRTCRLEFLDGATPLRPRPQPITDPAHWTTSTSGDEIDLPASSMSTQMSPSPPSVAALTWSTLQDEGFPV